MPVRNATRYLRVKLEKIDVEKGVPQDPENCAIAQCVKRVLKVDFASINASNAYIESIEDGRSVVDYYRIKGRTRDYIVSFDKEENIRDKDGNIIVPMCEIYLVPPAPSECFDYKPPKKEIKYTTKPQKSSEPSIKYEPFTPKPKREIRLIRTSIGKIRFDRN